MTGSVHEQVLLLVIGISVDDHAPLAVGILRRLFVDGKAVGSRRTDAQAFFIGAHDSSSGLLGNAVAQVFSAGVLASVVEQAVAFFDDNFTANDHLKKGVVDGDGSPFSDEVGIVFGDRLIACSDKSDACYQYCPDGDWKGETGTFDHFYQCVLV